MLFNKHLIRENTHALLSASKHHWVNYDDDKLGQLYRTHRAAVRGTELHALAHSAIRLGVKLADIKKTMNLYVNDAIGYRMTPEQILFYSYNCFGTADAISFHDNMLRVHDLKTGSTPTSERQLYVYAAMFCLEYETKPHSIETELRIYQNNAVKVYEADPHTIAMIMSKIISADRQIEMLRQEAMG